MRRDSSRHSVLDIYRRVSAVGAMLAIVALLVVSASLLAEAFGLHPGQWLAAIAAVSLSALVVLWRFGYAILRKQLGDADEERRQVIAMAHRDALTGTHTRSYFFDVLKSHVHHGSSMPVGYLQLDMDHLKALNDGHGHAAGDAALLHLTETIRRLAPDAVIGRLGGDEFGIAVVGQDSKRVLFKLGERILEALRAEVQIGGRTTKLSATIGVAVSPEDAADVQELMSRADLALYRGKRNGRSMVVGYDHDMLVDERHNRFVQRELRAALLLNEIKVYYQPIYLADGVTLRSYEALVRWHHAHRGIIPPIEFIPIAEQSDIIDRLGDMVLRQACADFAALGLPIAVNVSPVQLRRADFAGRFSDILREGGLSGANIVVEITENVLMRAGGVESVNLTALRAMGVRIAIDDLGTGHASLEYLRSFAFDIIKIDKSYIANLLTRRVDRMIVTALCDIARTIGVEVIAEGVETTEQLEALRSIGCGAVQGYLLGRPAPLSAHRAAARVAAAA